MEILKRSLFGHVAVTVSVPGRSSTETTLALLTINTISSRMLTYNTHV